MREHKLTNGICFVCGGSGKSLTTECWGRRMDAEQMVLVATDVSDYRNGHWQASKGRDNRPNV
jgi:hypothetical protein